MGASVARNWCYSAVVNTPDIHYFTTRAGVAPRGVFLCYSAPVHTPDIYHFTGASVAMTVVNLQYIDTLFFLKL